MGAEQPAGWSWEESWGCFTKAVRGERWEVFVPCRIRGTLTYWVCKGLDDVIEFPTLEAAICYVEMEISNGN